MLQFSYLSIAFAVVFYLVFGVTVRFMTLSDTSRNKARLAILITSFSLVAVSSLMAGLLNLNRGKFVLGAFFILLSIAAFVIISAILFELHHIKIKVKMRRFMVLFDIVDKYISEGKTTEEIISYLVEIQKLTLKEARDFLEFITDPQNHQFLSDVNEKIHEAQLLKNSSK